MFSIEFGQILKHLLGLSIGLSTALSMPTNRWTVAQINIPQMLYCPLFESHL